MQQDLMLKTHALVTDIAQVLSTYPETMEITIGGVAGLYSFPYITIPNVLEYFVSRCVKVAGGTEEDMADLLNQTLTDLKFYPAPINQRLVDRLRYLITFIKSRYGYYKCYDEYGTCAFRFIGFIAPSLDVQLRRN